MKKLPLFLLLTSLLMVLSGCGPESSRVSSRLSENIPKYIDCLGQTKKEVFQTLQIDRDPEPEEEGLNLGPFLPETIESKEFGLVLEFYSWEEKGRLRGFYYTTNLPNYADEEELPEAADYLRAEKLVEIMNEAYGEPSDNPWQIGTSFSDVEDILQLTDQEDVWLIDRWNVPIPKALGKKIDSELTYLEAFVELRKKDDEFYVQFGYSLSATEKAIKEGSWLPGEMAYLH